MKKSPRVLILGFGNVMNYGGEAIVQGTCKLINEVWPNASLTIATNDIESAQRVLVDFKNITFVEDKLHFTIKRIFKGIFRRLGIGKGEPLRYNYSLVDSHDIFLSVGGDLFVEQPSGKITRGLEDLMKMGERIQKKGGVYCLWGASVGPFNDPFYFEKVAANLCQADLITAREDKAVAYLESMGCKENVVKVADPAFMMDPKVSDILLRENHDEIIIGINLSQIAMNRAFRKQDYTEGLETVAKSIEALLYIDTKIKIVFIPHVMSSKGSVQDDFNFLGQIKNKLNFESDRMMILPNNLGSQKTKYIMQQCDVIIAARMHCFVGSVSIGTPTIMIAYSDKGYGMARYIYNSDKWTMRLDEVTETSLVKRTKELLLKKQEIKEKLLKDRELWQNESRDAIEALKKVYESK